ncbi:MAG TPA: (d)CMP kinase [Phycisphaerae bacterium]|nr:(d)CMP kinase [Phycisphaerae bacterium]
MNGTAQKGTFQATERVVFAARLDYVIGGFVRFQEIISHFAQIPPSSHPGGIFTVAGIIITIDGTAGSGKSAAALELARRLKIPHLDTGAMYRAVALDALQNSILDDPDRIGHRVRLLSILFDWSKEPAGVLLNGVDVSEAIRRPEVTAVTYVAADNPWVREELVKQQRLIGEKWQSLVTEGRDQGTIVFPGARYKFYLNAHPEERARRRIAQLAAKGISAELSDVLQQIMERDQRDQSREIGRLAPAKDAIDVDTTDLTLEGTVEAMLAHIKPEARPPA